MLFRRRIGHGDAMPMPEIERIQMISRASIKAAKRTMLPMFRSQA